VTAVDVADERGDAKNWAEFGVPRSGLGSDFAFVSVLLVAESNRHGLCTLALVVWDGLVLSIPECDVLECDRLGATNGGRRQCLTRTKSKKEARNCEVGERFLC
jgi:hypothetical protein